MSSNVSYFMHEAKKLSQKSEMNHKHGCVIVRNGKIVATGYNHHYTSSHTNCNGIPKKFSVHAEECAVKNYCKKHLKSSSNAPIQIYIVRCGIVYGKQKLKNSKPCESCRNFMSYIEPNKIYYSIDDTKAVVEYNNKS